MAVFRSDIAAAELSHVDVFKIYAQFASRASDDDLRLIFAQLKRRHIALAMEAGPLTASEKCGRGVEGYGGQTAVGLAERIKQLGGELAYLAMDEPAWYGHNFDGKNACQAQLLDVARDAASNMAAVRAIFPDVRIGDIEPAGQSSNDRLLDEYREWADAFREAAGKPLSFFHVDVQWASHWLATIHRLADILRGKGIAFGIIYNGDEDDVSDKAWAAHAEEHYLSYEAETRGSPDHAVFQSWMPYPSHLLPDSETGSFTHLLKGYFRPRARIEAYAKGVRISGRLIDQAGAPLAGRKIALEGIDTESAGTLSGVSLSGTVPPAASQAVLGLRINAECNCSGSVDISIGIVRYREGGGAEYRLTPGRDGSFQKTAINGTSAEQKVTPFRLTAAPGRAIRYNAPAVMVTPGATFALDIPWRVSPASQGSGYLALIFLDSANNEVRRVRLMLRPSWRSKAFSRTDESGRFAFIVGSAAVARGTWRITFAGDERLRQTSALLPDAP
jgi:hypothetical protein